ncbi:DNA primase [Streptomyces sp. NPDC002787]
MNRMGLGLAVGAGYVLGRTKKMKLAFAVGTMVAGKRMHLSPRALADLVSQQLQNNPQFKEIGDQLREDLRGVGKAATGALVERQIEGLADRLHGRTSQVRDQLAGVAPDLPGRGDRDHDDAYTDDDEFVDEEEYADGDEYDDGREYDDGESREGDDEKPSRRRPAKRTAPKAEGKPAAKKSAAKKAPAKKTGASTRKAAAKKTAAKTTAAKKTAAKKTAPGKAPAKKAARKATRARTTRGGGGDD